MDIQVYNINELLNKLDIKEGEIPMYESLLSLDYNFFYPVIMGVLNGDIHIQDFTLHDPYFADVYPMRGTQNVYEQEMSFQSFKEFKFSKKLDLKDVVIGKLSGKTIPAIEVENNTDKVIDKIRRLYNIRKQMQDAGQNVDELTYADAANIFQDVKNHLVTTIINQIQLSEDDYRRIYEERMDETYLRKQKQQKYFFLLNQSYYGDK